MSSYELQHAASRMPAGSTAGRSGTTIAGLARRLQVRRPMKPSPLAVPNKRPVARSAGPASPAVSVVIPTCERRALLRRCLDAVLAQELDGGSFEVIVVDDAHDSETLHMIRELQSEPTAEGDRPAPDILYLRPRGGRGPAVARNRGWRNARAELIAFTDDDTVPEPGWLANGLGTMAQAPEWSAACGRVVVPLDSPKHRPTNRELMTLGLQDTDFMTANVFVRRRALEEIAGFDEQFTRPWREASDLQFRLARDAGEVGRCDDAVVLHPTHPESWGVCLRQQRNVYFDALLYKKHRRLYRERIRRVPPWRYYAIVALAVAALIAAALGGPGVALGCAGGAAALVLELAWRRLRDTSLAPRHLAEIVATSALVPFLSVYWRLRGAWRFRVLFL
jgi:glycosyltransferase involved in cell wall biosynthesis